MMRVFLNGLAASAGGGLTYLRNVVPQLSARTDVQTTVAVGPGLRQEMGTQPNISFLEFETPATALRRFWWEQTVLPRLVRRSGADVLISAGNFALRKSPVPQILLSRNSLYTSRDFFRDLRARGDYGIWLDTRIKRVLAKQSIHWADCTVAPSHAFADELCRWSGNDVQSIHHGFAHDTFFRDTAPLPAGVQEKLDAAKGCLRLLFVSHYNYYRNFETLLRAVPVLQSRLRGQSVKLFLTCKLRSQDNPGPYRAESAAALVQKLGITSQVVELGTVPYPLLHQLYKACDIYVTPAYAESFSHPLVEAMASGLPVVASDLPVHREICGDAAVYFHRFSPEELSEQVLRVALSKDLARAASGRGLLRCREFSWRDHADQVIALAGKLAGCSPNNYSLVRSH